MSVDCECEHNVAFLPQFSVTLEADACGRNFAPCDRMMKVAPRTSLPSTSDKFETASKEKVIVRCTQCENVSRKQLIPPSPVRTSGQQKKGGGSDQVSSH